MVHRLTKRERSRIWEAFTEWDIIGEGTIPAGVLCKVMESLGEIPSTELRMHSNGPDAADERIGFEEFLIMTVGPPRAVSRNEYKEDLSEAFAAIDDGSGYVPLRDLMRVLHEHMEEVGDHVTDGELVDIYRHALDVSFFETAGRSLAREAMWKYFEEEFADLRKGQRTGSIDSVDSGLRHRDGDDDELTSETAHMVKFTLVDLAGKSLMSDVVTSTWSVQALQQHIEKILGVPVHRQFLHFAHDDGFTYELCPKSSCLSKAGVSDGSTLVLLIKDELKLNYHQFLDKFFDGEFGSSTSHDARPSVSFEQV